MRHRRGGRSGLRCVVILLATALLGAGSAAAQARDQAPQASTQQQAPLAAGEVGRLFDAYALMRAQDTLGLDEAQFARFVGRFRVLLETRRKHALARVQLVRELAELTRSDAPADEESLRTRLRALDDEDARERTEVARAREGVDEVLTVAQRARLRVLEDQLERRRWELMARARDGARPGRRGPPR